MYYWNKSRILWHSNFTNCRSVKILITWFYRINHPALAVRLGLRVMKIIFFPYQSAFFRFCPPPTLFTMLSIWFWGNKPSTLKVILSKLGRNKAPFPRVDQPYSWSTTELPLSQSNKRSLAMHVCPFLDNGSSDRLPNPTSSHQQFVHVGELLRTRESALSSCLDEWFSRKLQAAIPKAKAIGLFCKRQVLNWHILSAVEFHHNLD